MLTSIAVRSRNACGAVQRVRFVLCRVSYSARALCRFRQLQHVLKLTSYFFCLFFCSGHAYGKLGQKAIVDGVFMQEMKVSKKCTDSRDLAAFLDSPSEKLPDEQKKEAIAKNRRIWTTHFAAVVSPWLSKLAGDGAKNAQDTVAAAARRDLDAVLAGTQQLLLGLAHMGERMVLHHDVKPANIMLNDGVWTWVDLGMSCIIGQKVREDQRSNCYKKEGVTCKPIFDGTPGFVSPSAYAGYAVALATTQDKTKSYKNFPRFCVFNRRYCKGSESVVDMFDSKDSFGVGIIFLKYLIGYNGTIGMMPRFGSDVRYKKKTRSEYFAYFSSRVAHFLALGNDYGKYPTSVSTEYLRKSVRARARALLELALAAAVDKTISADATPFGSRPATAAGIGNGVTPSLCTKRGEGNPITFNTNTPVINILQRVLETPMEICDIWNPPTKTQDASCTCAQEKRMDPAIPNAWFKKDNAGPGTDALLDLLANLLSPSLTPGLSRDATTLHALATSVDDVRAKLYKQWNVDDAEKKLTEHLGKVNTCIGKNSCGKSGVATCTAAEVSAYCRWNQNRLSSVNAGYEADAPC